MANINELEGLGSTGDFELDPNNVPEQYTSFTPTPPPGDYRFRLPGDMSSVWNTIEAKVKDEKKTRLRAEFVDATALLITQSPGGAHDHDPFRCYISNAERPRDKEGRMASDMYYLLRFGLKDEGDYKTNLDYGNALMKYAGAEFMATVEWSAYCNDKKPVRIQEVNQETGEATFVTVEQQMGCGKRIYQRDIGRLEDGTYPTEFLCPECGAILRPFANLSRFRPIPENR